MIMCKDRNMNKCVRLLMCITSYNKKKTQQNKSAKPSSQNKMQSQLDQSIAEIIEKHHYQTTRLRSSKDKETGTEPMSHR